MVGKRFSVPPEFIELTGRFWPKAEVRKFPKAAIRVAGFGESCRPAWVERKDQ
jgi:hypothetical protein